MSVKDLHIGYYRYTDIAFEWYHKFEDPKHMDAINAFLARDALVHPDHPFRRPGDKGVELWMVTLKNGEARLCFSSAQVEYARYYVKAVGLVDINLPLPASHYMITRASLSSVSPVYYNQPQTIKKDLTRIGKNNKRLKNTGDSRLMSIRLDFGRIQGFWTKGESTWLAIDFEAWEMHHKDLTEFGYTVVRIEKGQETEKSEGHWTVYEHNSLRNTKYVIDNRDHYEFGTTQSLKLKVFYQNIRELVAKYAALSGPLFLVFHDATGDIKYMQEQISVPEAREASRMIPDTPATEGIFVIDTAEMFAALEGHSGERRGLERMCRLLGLRDTSHMHNAGNDAHWTLEALRSMASGQPLDTQREERWPSRTEVDQMGRVGLKVVREAWEVEEEIDDMEGMFGDFLGEADPEPEAEEGAQA